jgi:hypothetical protein
MKPPSLRAILALCLSLIVCPPLLDAQTISFEVLTEFAYPGAHSTNAHGINDAGDVVGEMHLDFVDFANGFERYADGTVSMPIIFPGSGVRDTIATAINNEGTIAGWYTDSEGHPHGFFLSGDVYTSYDHPDAVFSTKINGINDAGDFVGTYSDTEGIFRNFASVGGKLHEITIPGVTTSPEPTDINNDGDIVGSATGDAGTGGFRRESNGAVRFPLQRESGVYTIFYGTNERREAVGQENNSGLYFGGGTTYAIYDFSGLINNSLTGINRHGVICGYGFSSDDLILYSYLVRRVITRTAE